MCTLRSSSKWSKYYININTIHIYYTIDKKIMDLLFLTSFLQLCVSGAVGEFDDTWLLLWEYSDEKHILTHIETQVWPNWELPQSIYRVFFFFCRHSFTIAIGLGSLFNRKQRAVRSGFMEQLQTISDKDPLRQQKDMFRLASQVLMK